MYKVTDSFPAVGDDGQNYTIHVLTQFADGGTGEPRGEKRGEATMLRTEDGKEVTRSARGQYKVTPTGVTLRSEAPNAV